MNSPIRNSEATLMDSIHRLSNAGGSVIQVRTREPIRAALVLRKNLLGSDCPYAEWDVVNGVRRFTMENYTNHRLGGESKDFNEALSFPLEQLRNPTSAINAASDKVHYFVFVNPQAFIAGNPHAIELLQQYAAILPSTNVCTILITPEVTISEVPSGTMLVTELPTPTASELTEILTRIITDAKSDTSVFPDGADLDEQDIAQVANMAMGLSLHEAETYAAISIIQASTEKERSITLERLLDGLAKGKTAVVKQSEILELTHAGDIGNVGGMGRLKDWVSARADCYGEDAKHFGVEAPKGIVLVGVPGSGKSLVAKAISSVLSVPVVRLDFGRVFSKFVGDSESRVRSALKMVEAMAPVVLFVDEIDKGLGGAGGGGDSGTSARVLGSYLTWLQECKAPVFNVVTANRVSGLPPELFRRGRFDQIFAVGMPNADERREVLEIHLRLRGRGIEQFSADDVAQFLAASEGYVPAEIESTVKDALVAAFGDKTCTDLEMRHMLAALKETIPMSRSHAADMATIIEWTNTNAVSVSYPPKGDTPVSTTSAGARILRARGRN